MGARARAIEGYTKESELEVLRRLAASMPAEAVVVEVGSFRGRSTVADHPTEPLTSALRGERDRDCE